MTLSTTIGEALRSAGEWYSERVRGYDENVIKRTTNSLDGVDNVLPVTDPKKRAELVEKRLQSRQRQIDIERDVVAGAPIPGENNT